MAAAAAAAVDTIATTVRVGTRTASKALTARWCLTSPKPTNARENASRRIASGIGIGTEGTEVDEEEGTGVGNRRTTGGGMAVGAVQEGPVERLGIRTKDEIAKLGGTKEADLRAADGGTRAGGDRAARIRLGEILEIRGGTSPAKFHPALLHTLQCHDGARKRLFFFGICMHADEAIAASRRVGAEVRPTAIFAVVCLVCSL